jgi:integrase/recombinase XerD
VTGKGGRRRTILLDDRPFVAELRRYLRTRGYRHGPLFRAAKNGTGDLLRYQSAHELWQKYAAAAGVTAAIHQLRHSHATELVNDGVSLQTIRKRLGNRNLQTTLRYAKSQELHQTGENLQVGW